MGGHLRRLAVSRTRALALLLFASGVASLLYQVVWLRRLGLVLGASATAAAVTVAAFMGGLALGGLLSRRLPPGLRTYAGLEAGAAAWAVVFPWLLLGLTPALDALPQTRWVLAGLLLLPPTTLLGATWPVLAGELDGEGAATLYAANTTGALAGVILGTFALLPWLGVRGTEVAAAGVGLGAAAVAWTLRPRQRAPASLLTGPVRWEPLFAGAATGFAGMGLEVVWMRLAAVGFGGTVQTHGLVLAAFLATLAAGAWVGRRWPADPRVALGWALGAVGTLALVGALVWGELPLLVAAWYRSTGPAGVQAGTLVLGLVAMGGAPVASGLAFSLAVRVLEGGLSRGIGWLYAVNSAAGAVGAILAGLVLVPGLEIGSAVAVLSLTVAAAGAVLLRRPWPLALPLLLVVVQPRWDARLYAVGVHLRVSDFADPSREALRRFAGEGWELLDYDHGPTGAVAVGRSTRTGNVWLSINGKVDASTGDDMPTQRLSGLLPVGTHPDPSRVLVVGLASGVTAGAVLEDARVRELTVAEIEPAVVRASRYFDHASGAPLDDPRTTLVVDDARAFLRSSGTWDVIVSEPSNPWISGVSNLFTAEYWQLTRDHLAPDGVMCQWVQLYGMGPDEVRGLVRTFTSVYPDAWLVETIPGSDVLLLGGAVDPARLVVPSRLDPDGVRRLGGQGWLNTDDRPRVEWRAPHYLHLATAGPNQRLIEAAAAPPAPGSTAAPPGSRPASTGDGPGPRRGCGR